MFGAKCTRELGPGVTHLVTTSVSRMATIAATQSHPPIQPETKKAKDACAIPGVKVVYRHWLKYSIDNWRREPEDKYLCRPVAKPATPANPGATGSIGPVEPIQSKTPPGTPPLSPGLSTGPTTPASQRIIPVESDFMLDPNELEEMDDELAEFLGSGDEDDRGSLTTENDTDDASMTER